MLLDIFKGHEKACQKLGGIESWSEIRDDAAIQFSVKASRNNGCEVIVINTLKVAGCRHATRRENLPCLFFSFVPHSLSLPLSLCLFFLLSSMSTGDAPQVLTSHATVADAQAAIERSFALIRQHGTLIDSEYGGMGSAVFGGSSSVTGTGCLAAGSGNATGIGAVVMGTGVARGIGSIQASSDISPDVSRILSFFRTAVCHAAASDDLRLLKLPTS
jgi:hypothetical protein